MEQARLSLDYIAKLQDRGVPLDAAVTMATSIHFDNHPLAKIMLRQVYTGYHTPLIFENYSISPR